MDEDQAVADDFGQWGRPVTSVNTSSQVVAIGNDGHIYHEVRSGGGAWSGFMPMSGYAGVSTFSASSVAVAGMPGGSSQVVAVGNDGKAYHNIRHADGTWQGWRSLGFAASSVAVAGMPAGGSAQFVAVGNDGTAYHNIRHADGTWQGWRSLGFAAKQVSIAAIADGSAQVLVEAPNGTVYHNIRYTPSGNWQGFRPLTGYGAPTFVAGGIGIGGFFY